MATFAALLKSSDLLEQARTILRQQVPLYDKDRYFAKDIEKAVQLMQNGQIAKLLNTHASAISAF